MSLFVVDKEKCKRDGICVAECPRGIIEIKEQNLSPTPIDRADELCINNLRFDFHFQIEIETNAVIV